MNTEINLMRYIYNVRDMKEEYERLVRNENREFSRTTSFIWSLFIDLKSAFDSVDHEIMF